MTISEFGILLTALVMAGGFFLSMRSTSYNELKILYESLKNDFDEYKEESKDRRNEMEQEIKTLTSQNEMFKRYISKLIAHLEKVGEIPDKMDTD